jgi:hypothetical protein
MVVVELQYWIVASTILSWQVCPCASSIWQRSSETVSVADLMNCFFFKIAENDVKDFVCFEGSVKFTTFGCLVKMAPLYANSSF